MKHLFIIAALLLICCLPASAQLSAYHDRALAPVPLPGIPSLVVVPIAYGQVRVCTGNVVGGGSPCTPVASIFDLFGGALTVSGGNFGQVFTDVTGQFSFQCNPGVYTVQVAASASNTPQLNYLIACPSIASGINILSLNNVFTGNNTFNNPITGSITGTAGGLNGSPAITISKQNGVPILDGTVYPFTDVGLLAAIAALGGPGTVNIPTGTVTLSNPIITLTDNQHIQCAGMNATKINYTGGATTAIFDIGTKSDGTGNHFNISINGCTISGNANVQYAIRTRGVHHSDFSHNSLINVTAAGIQTNYAVMVHLNDIHTSLNEQTLSPQPVNCMILTGPDGNHKTTASTVIMPMCEGVSGTGLVFGNTSNVQVIAGTSEQNNKGITLAVGTTDAIINGLDTEANAVSNIEDAGFQNNIENVVGNGLVHILSTANSSHLTGYDFDNITIDAVAFNTNLDHVGYNNSGIGSIIDNGTQTSKLRVENLAGGVYDTDTFPGANGISIHGGAALTAQSGTGSICLTTNCTLITPTFTGVASGTGLQIFNTATSCTTAAAIGATCTTAAITLPVAEPDTSYRTVCIGKAITNVPVVITTTNSSNTQFTITIAALTAAAATFASYDCLVGHN